MVLVGKSQKAKQKSRKAEKQKSRKAEKQKSRKAEKQRPSCCGLERETTVGCIREAMHRLRIGGVLVAPCTARNVFVGARLRAMLLSFGFTIGSVGRRTFLGPSYRLRPARRVTFANRGKSNQNRLPLHPAPAAPGFPRFGAAPGARHEGPSMALAAFAASLPLNPFHDTCARPADGANWCGLLVLVWQSQKAKQKSRKAEAELL
ncbi:hypothetical protein JQR85_06830 [Stutzerimonas urumqiensis]|uniref:hypothetical protein n=1 Tax=Stutzerimonas urumqiensis TaxID=638269 RepID=UPI003DA30E07